MTAGRLQSPAAPASATAPERLLAELAANEHVVGLSVQRGASVKLPGDIVAVQPGQPGQLVTAKAALT